MRFVGAKEVGFLPERGDIYVDCTPPDGKGKIYDHHFGAKNKPSASQMIYEDLTLPEDSTKNAVKDIVEIANLQDTAKFPPKEFMAGYVNTYLLGLRQVFRDDATVMTKMIEFLDIVFMSRKTSHVSRIEYEKLETHGVVEIGNLKVAYYEIPTHMNINPAPYLFEEVGVDLCVYKQGYNIGITRNINCTFDLNKLKPMIEEDGWFFHRDGFIASRGTAKYPSTSPSKYSISNLLDMLRKIS
jgi:hypothetical protein